MSNSNNIYNILGKLKGITDTAALTPETPVEKIYESVEAKGDIMEAVRSLESKFQTFKESAKPDFLDMDKDGDKKEPMKKAAKEKKAKPFSSDDYDEYGVRHSSSFNQPPKKAVKDKNNAKGAFKDMFGGDAKDLTSKLKIKEGQGPYTLDDPKHPKFKANYEKFKKSNPDCKLADFVAAMKKKEKNLSEAAYDEPEAPNADAIAKRKRLQALKDRQEDERAERGGSNTNTPIRKVAGKAYGGAAQKDDVSDLDEVAPPGKKAERMVKHIKKGYAKDGNLSKKEKGIAYATAWKAKKAGHVEEGCKFGDTIENSAPKMKKSKLAKLKEARVMEETDYFYEQIAKALAGVNPHLDTAGPEFVDAVRKEMVAQGIAPNKARNILLMDEDFLGDVATSYGHYCKDVAECGAPMNSHLGGVEELDEIAKLAGLTAPTVEQSTGLEQSDDVMDEGNAFTGKLAATPQGEKFELGTKEFTDTSTIEEAASRKDFRMVADLIKNIPDEAKRKELAQHHADIFKQQNPRFSHDKFYAAADVVNEADMAEGNEFSGALAAAKASGAKEFEVDGKRYTVKEDINVSITANGQEDALNLFRKLAGMEEVEAPTALAVELPHDAETAIAQGIVEPVEVEVDEERDIEYTNTPNEKIGPVSAAIPSGDDLHRSKEQFRKEYPGDNPMAVREDSNLWKKYTGMLKGLLK
jgi:hypothetical protein